ncbi:MAG TPA: LamG-like jellyroll fold domain-containing protein, partial [Bryobacteraceae bacterium]
MRLLALWLFSIAAMEGQTCPNLSAVPSLDYSNVVASSDTPLPPGNWYEWFVNGQPSTPGQVSQLFLLHADGNATSAEGITAIISRNVNYAPGKWGSALTVGSGGTLSYPRNGSIDFNEGSIEMWIAPLADGNDPRYSAYEQELFYYSAPNGDHMKIAQSNTSAVLYGGGSSGGKSETAYNSQTTVSSWHAGEWHHVVFTFSSSGNFMRFYLDGVLSGDTNEKHYTPPDLGSDHFYLGVSPGGQTAGYLIDEVRIWNRPMTMAEIQANSTRLDQPRNDEVWFPLAQSSPGDSIVFRFNECVSAPFAYSGIPISQPNPNSTLLAPGTTQLQLSVQSAQPASCGWAIGGAPYMAMMIPFTGGQGGTAHQTMITGLSPDPNQVNDVYVRCDSAPEYALHLLYRSLGQVNPHFPRKGNLWGSANEFAAGVAHAARIDLYLGAGFSPSQIRALRAANPDIIIETSINTVENSGLSEDYYLHDIHGNRIEVWPGTYRLNLTKPYVAEYQANFAYQQMLASGMLLDGCFFDNFFTTQSWLTTDIYGNAVQLDANEDGVPDDPASLDAAWGAGVYHELNTWRSLMPNAYASGHLPRPPQTQFSTIFNGDSIGFLSPETADGTVAFGDFWAAYQPWWTVGRAPVVTMVESAPPFQIGYGYGYNPQANIPPSTLQFAQNYYPYMRFGLAFTLMNDGYFAHEFGDTWHGNDWWYDELDYDLGLPLAPAQQVAMPGQSTASLLTNGGFESSFNGTWVFELTNTDGAAGSVRQDTSGCEKGSCAHISITAVDGTS